ncbi:class I SAM-dependent methyltransferase [Evansella sp. LMS18]|uniref:class I SAM-dependent methyltransferase n=1 Tax=Evansella sp. LMS18 TaxID=2924033 RepID=UPI0020CFE956|nr:class I SAM-dependent methyltransferase [Evansella sp. LMS18]UTR10941.1 class I SAM-dependent methyltransferase [Evansella sp. LMS18]
MRKFSGKEFDDLVDFFDRMACSSWLVKVHEELLKETGTWEGKSVLDVGCGTGRLLLRGADSTTKIYGVDISEGMVNRAAELAEREPLLDNPVFKTADAEKLPFSENKFDIVLSTCVVFLLPDPDPALKEMYRVLKPGGLLALVNPSEILNVEMAHKLAEQWQLEKEEENALKQWGKVTEKRLSFNDEDLESLLNDHRFKQIRQKTYLENISLLSFGVK